MRREPGKLDFRVRDGDEAAAAAASAAATYRLPTTKHSSFNFSLFPTRPRFTSASPALSTVTWLGL